MRGVAALVVSGSVVLGALSVALAGGGWYLLQPPHAKGALMWDASRPFSEWTMMRPFDTARECEAERAASEAELWAVARDLGLVDKVLHELVTLEKGGATDLAHDIQWRRSWRCIATDDPRLAPRR